jgi:hypothetical protein
MGVFDKRHYGVWNDSSVINEMLDIVKADVAKAQQETGKGYFIFKNALKFWDGNCDVEQMLSFGIDEDVFCLGYDEEMIDENGGFCGEVLEDWRGGYTFVDMIDFFAAIYETLGTEPDSRFAELLDNLLEERANAEKEIIKFVEQKQAEKNVGYIGIDPLFTLDWDDYYYEDEPDDLDGFFINHNINSVKVMDGKLWLSGERAEDLDEKEDPNDEYFWTDLEDWCWRFTVDLAELYINIKTSAYL